MKQNEQKVEKMLPSSQRNIRTAFLQAAVTIPGTAIAAETLGSFKQPGIKLWVEEGMLMIEIKKVTYGTPLTNVKGLLFE
jgi:hypothetical protein